MFIFFKTSIKSRLLAILSVSTLFVLTPFALDLFTTHATLTPLLAQAASFNPITWITDAAGTATSWALGSIVMFIGKIFIFFFGFVLSAMQFMFTVAIDYTIINFTTQFNAIVTSIDSIWSIFRDLANIVLIGVFIYIAFAVMLNVTGFASEKYAVRVIVIAMLINFSLFFTQVIIDISHVTAIQFHEMLKKEIVSAGGDPELGIAGLVLQQTDFLSIFETQELLAEARAADKSQIGAALTYIIFVSVLSALMIGVILYGIILLVTRAVTLIFLMITSPLAFAAFMVPQMESHWKKWWSALLRNAFFAPLLMLFLWATARIIKGLNGNSGDIINFIANPNTSNIAGFFNVIIIVALFAGSMKLANSLSLTGSSMATGAGKWGFGTALKWSGAGILARMGLSGIARGGRSATGLFELTPAQRKQRAYLREHGTMMQKIGARMSLAGDKNVTKFNTDLRNTKALKNLEKAGLNFGKGIDNYQKTVRDLGKDRHEGNKAAADITQAHGDAADMKEIGRLMAAEREKMAHDTAQEVSGNTNDTSPRAEAAKTTAPVQTHTPQSVTTKTQEVEIAGGAEQDVTTEMIQQGTAKTKSLDAQLKADAARRVHGESGKATNAQIIEQLSGIRSAVERMDEAQQERYKQTIVRERRQDAASQSESHSPAQARLAELKAKHGLEGKSDAEIASYIDTKTKEAEGVINPQGAKFWRKGRGWKGRREDFVQAEAAKISNKGDQDKLIDAIKGIQKS